MLYPVFVLVLIALGFITAVLVNDSERAEFESMQERKELTAKKITAQRNEIRWMMAFMNEASREIRKAEKKLEFKGFTAKPRSSHVAVIRLNETIAQHKKNWAEDKARYRELIKSNDQMTVELSRLP